MRADVLQLSDLHLMCDRERTLRGVCPHDALSDVLRYVEAEVRAGRWDFDFIVISGDLAQDEQLATYELLRELLGEWSSRCRLIPGNHDDRQRMRRVFPELVPQDGDSVNFSVVANGWRLIGLDSHVDGDGAGHIDASQIGWLAEQLALHRTEPTILFVHHPPFFVQSAWLDNVSLRQPEPFLELIESFPQVRAISAGHVHQQFQGRLGRVELLTTPSTAIQYRPYADVPERDPIPPGFRTFRIEGGTYSTEVVRLPDPEFPPRDRGPSVGRNRPEA